MSTVNIRTTTGMNNQQQVSSLIQTNTGLPAASASTNPTFTASQSRRLRLSGNANNNVIDTPSSSTANSPMRPHIHTPHGSNHSTGGSSIEIDDTKRVSPSVKDLKKVFEFNQQTSIHSKSKSFTFKSSRDYHNYTSSRNSHTKSESGAQDDISKHVSSEEERNFTLQSPSFPTPERFENSVVNISCGRSNSPPKNAKHQFKYSKVDNHNDYNKERRSYNDNIVHDMNNGSESAVSSYVRQIDIHNAINTGRNNSRNSPDEFLLNDKKYYNVSHQSQQQRQQQQQQPAHHQKEQSLFTQDQHHNQHQELSELNNNRSGLSERRRKMALAKKHARSSTSSNDQQTYPHNTDPTIETGTETEASTIINNTTSKDSDYFVSFHQEVSTDDFLSSTSSSNHNHDKSKIPSSPNRRRKFELVKESMKHRRNGHGPSHNTKSTNNNSHQHQGEYDNEHDHDWKQQNHQHLHHPLVEEVSSLDKVQAQDYFKNKDSFDTRSTTTGTNNTYNPRKNNGEKNNASTAQMLSTASLSTGTFETFDSDFNSFQQHQQNQQQQYHTGIDNNVNRMKPVQEMQTDFLLRASTSSEIRWGIDDTAPSSKSSSRRISWNDQDANSTTIQDLHQLQQVNIDNNPIMNQHNQSQHHFHNNNNMSSHAKSSTMIQDGGDNDVSNLSHYQIASVASGGGGGGGSGANSPGSYNSNNQKPQYFAPANGSTWDDDDETQFNSVTDINDKRRTRHVETVNLNIHPLQSTTLSTKSDKSSSYVTTGFVSSSKRVFHVADTGSNVKENDDESFNGSVGNHSWTGRMRATQKTRYNGASTLDERYALSRNDSPSRKSMYSNDEGNTELKYFHANQFLTRDIGTTPVYVDATRGVEEIKKFAKEDPTSTAIGVGLCGALCGALVFGPIGLVLAGSTGAAIYGVSQMPEDKRAKMKMKATSTVEKIKSQTSVASDYVVNNCGGCLIPEAPTKQVNDENDAASRALPLSLGPNDNPQVETGDGIKKYSPQQIVIKNGPIGGAIQKDLLIKKESNALLAQANQRKFNRLAPACCRMSRITPVNQIHSLDPSLHSRAWLDVMASAWTSRDEKNEAMEEILLLAKDKGRARMLLEVSDVCNTNLFSISIQKISVKKCFIHIVYTIGGYSRFFNIYSKNILPLVC